MLKKWNVYSEDPRYSNLDLDWPSAVTAIAADLILHANYDRPPRTFGDWALISERFGLELHVAPVRGGGAVLMEDMLVVAPGQNLRETFRRIAHELGEHVLLSEYAAPFHYPYTGQDSRLDRHEVAQRLEWMLT